MTFKRIGTGKKGEGLALSYLREQGYRIIGRNYKTAQGEIDIIGDDGGCISFLEVRSMNAGGPGSPEYTINRRKQGQITKVVLSYIKKYRLEDRNCRFDVVCIESVDGASPKVRLIRNAFELDARYGY